MEDHTTRKIRRLLGDRLIEALNQTRPDTKHDPEGVELAMLALDMVDRIRREPDTYANPEGDIDRLLDAVGKRLGASDA